MKCVFSISITVIAMVAVFILFGGCDGSGKSGSQDDDFGTPGNNKIVAAIPKPVLFEGQKNVFGLELIHDGHMEDVIIRKAGDFQLRRNLWQVSDDNSDEGDYKTSETSDGIERKTALKLPKREADINIVQLTSELNENTADSYLVANLDAIAQAPDKLGIVIRSGAGRSEKVYAASHPGDGKWHTLSIKTKIDEGTLPKDITFEIMKRPITDGEVMVDNASLRIDPMGEDTSKANLLRNADFEDAGFIGVLKPWRFRSERNAKITALVIYDPEHGYVANIPPSKSRDAILLQRIGNFDQESKMESVAASINAAASVYDNEIEQADDADIEDSQSIDTALNLAAENLLKGNRAGYIVASIDAVASEYNMLGLVLKYNRAKKEETIGKVHFGDGKWHKIEVKVPLEIGEPLESISVEVVRRKGATGVVLVDNAELSFELAVSWKTLDLIDSELLENGDLDSDTWTAKLVGWTTSTWGEGTEGPVRLSNDKENPQRQLVAVLPVIKDGGIGIRQDTNNFDERSRGKVLIAKADFKSSYKDDASIQLEVTINGKTQKLKNGHPGDGKWHKLEIRFPIPSDSHPSQVRFFAFRNAKSQDAVFVDDASLRIIEPE